jgi:peptidoglycan/LPS O-acetylase OafA/YrhL
MMARAPERRRRAVLLADRSASRDNVFDVLRLVAALAVLVSHCYPLTGRPDPIGATTGDTLGSIGVVVFFGISGFLVSRSWAAQPQVSAFAAKRLLRLMPGLVVAVWLTALVLGPAVTTLPLGDYLTSAQTWVYPARSSLLLTFNGRLPGVFTANPVSGAVNGSLWTLPVEAFAYVAVVGFGLLALARRRVALLAALVVLLLALSPPADLGSHLPAATHGTALGLDSTVVIHVLAAFVTGSALFAFRERVRLSWWHVLALTVLWVVSWGTGWGPVVASVLIPYAVLVIAYRAPLRLNVLTRPGDVSYGVYVYAFPVQQTFVLVDRGLAPMALAALAAPVTYGLALASWRLIEAPALALKRRVARRSLEPRVPAGPAPDLAHQPVPD